MVVLWDLAPYFLADSFDLCEGAWRVENVPLGSGHCENAAWIRDHSLSLRGGECGGDPRAIWFVSTMVSISGHLPFVDSFWYTVRIIIEMIQSDKEVLSQKKRSYFAYFSPRRSKLAEKMLEEEGVFGDILLRSLLFVDEVGRMLLRFALLAACFSFIFKKNLFRRAWYWFNSYGEGESRCSIKRYFWCVASMDRSNNRFIPFSKDVISMETKELFREVFLASVVAHTLASSFKLQFDADVWTSLLSGWRFQPSLSRCTFHHESTIHLWHHSKYQWERQMLEGFLPRS